MSFFNSKPWSKIPTDLLENKVMHYAESELGPALSFAPVLFYLAGSSKADEDGIFDIGNGVEFAQLCKVDSPETVFKIANEMTKCRVVAHVKDSTMYLFAEWEYPTRQTTPPTLADRYKKAQFLWSKKQQENSFFIVQSEKVDTVTNNENNTLNKCLNTIQQPVNECLNTIQAPEAPAAQIRRDKSRLEQSKAEQIKADVEKNTHRVDGVEGEKVGTSGELSNNSPTVPTTDNNGTVETIKTQETENIMTVPDWSIVPNSESSDTLADEALETEKEKAIFVPSSITKLLGDFFKNNNAAYNVNKGAPMCEKIAKEIVSCSDNVSDAELLTTRLICEFKRLHDEPGYYHDVPLMPAYMLKDKIWAQLSSRIGRVYGTKAEPKTKSVEEQARQDWIEHCEDVDNPEADFYEEYKRFGIDPNEPDAVQKLLRAKNSGAPVEEYASDDDIGENVF